MSALFNGEPAGDWTQLRGLHYGDGVFRTLLIWKGQVIDWDLQFKKLSADCTALDLKIPDAIQLYAESKKIAAEQDKAVLKIIVMRKQGGRGYRYTSSASDRLVLSYAAPLYSPECWDVGIETFACTFKLAVQPALAGIKHLNRLEQVMASRQWPDHADEGILCNEAGLLVSGTRSNLFWVKNNVLCTPSLDESGVSGMMRNKILALAESLGITTSVIKSSVAELTLADEAFVTNSLIGIWPLRQHQSRQWTSPGVVTFKLSNALQHPRLI